MYLVKIQTGRSRLEGHPEPKANHQWLFLPPKVTQSPIILSENREKHFQSGNGSHQNVPERNGDRQVFCLLNTVDIDIVMSYCVVFVFLGSSLA